MNFLSVNWQSYLSLGFVCIYGFLELSIHEKERKK
jgi:hypothetical protein